MKFNAKKETEKIIKFIRDYYQRNNLKGVVLGISGGKDSAVVAALFLKSNWTRKCTRSNTTMPFRKNRYNRCNKSS